jgi:tetratricopeptide (TPR) repeat protein
MISALLKSGVIAVRCRIILLVATVLITAAGSLPSIDPSQAQSNSNEMPAIQTESDEGLASLTQQAIKFSQNGQYDQALPAAKHALAVAERLYGADNAKVADNLRLLIVLLKKTKQSREAEPLMQRLLAIDRQKWGPDHPTVALDLKTLADLLDDDDHFCEAESFVREALAIDEKNSDKGAVDGDQAYLQNLIRSCNKQ